MKKFLSALLMIFVFSLVSSTTTFSIGEHNLCISTPEDFLNFSFRVHSGEDFYGKTVYLNNDIDLKELSCNFPIIGSSKHPFRGTFNGCQHTIKSQPVSFKGDCVAALFGYAENASFLNIRLRHCGVYGHQNVGGILGYGKNVYFLYCETVGPFVSGWVNVGGIVGFCEDSTIEFCENNCKVDATVYAGGIAGVLRDNARPIFGTVLLESNITYGFVRSVATITLDKRYGLIEKNYR